MDIRLIRVKMQAKATEKYGAVTAGGVMAHRYSTWFGHLYGVCCLPSSVLWAGAQIRAMEQVLTSFDAASPAVVTALTITVYTCIGGAAADAMNDVIQGTILIIGLVLLTYCEISAHGGLTLAASFASATHFTLDENAHQVEGGVGVSDFEAFCVAVFGGFMSQEIIAKMLAARSTKSAKRHATPFLGAACTPGLRTEGDCGGLPRGLASTARSHSLRQYRLCSLLQRARQCCANHDR